MACRAYLLILTVTTRFLQPIKGRDLETYGRSFPVSIQRDPRWCLTERG